MGGGGVIKETKMSTFTQRNCSQVFEGRVILAKEGIG
jgi:hypothetical protein